MGASSNSKLKKSKKKSEVSKILKIREKELAEFEKEGLFDYVDKERRLIDKPNFERLRVAVELKREFGVNIPGIDVILAMREKMTKMKTEMNHFLTEVRAQLGEDALENIQEISKKAKRD